MNICRASQWMIKTIFIQLGESIHHLPVQLLCFRGILQSKTLNLYTLKAQIRNKMNKMRLFGHGMQLYMHSIQTSQIEYFHLALAYSKDLDLKNLLVRWFMHMMWKSWVLLIAHFLTPLLIMITIPYYFNPPIIMLKLL